MLNHWLAPTVPLRVPNGSLLRHSNCALLARWAIARLLWALPKKDVVRCHLPSAGDVEVEASHLFFRTTSEELMLQLTNRSGVAESARRPRTLLGLNHVGRSTIASARAMTRTLREMLEDMDQDWALRPTKAFGRMPPRLRKAVDCIVLTLGRVSVPGSLRETPAALSFLVLVTLGFAADGSRAHASRG
eukprot:5506617-Pleurochrysis_carterae.AAC.1